MKSIPLRALAAEPPPELPRHDFDSLLQGQIEEILRKRKRGEPHR